jgi:hypothetical protein
MFYCSYIGMKIFRIFFPILDKINVLLIGRILCIKLWKEIELNLERFFFSLLTHM